MRIVMLTNTYFPHVGGVAKSVESFSRALRDLGHQVLVIAPEFPDMPETESDVLRVPAIQRFNGSDFSVRLPIPGLLSGPMEQFKPDLIHAHHPFLLGDTALRIASSLGVPLVFTHHTLYEEYTHYVSIGSESSSGSKLMRRFAIELSTGYANLCDHVIAPSQSLLDLIRQRGVVTPATIVPTGVDISRFEGKSRPAFREAHGIPLDSFVVGHIGRLAPEKNLMFLTRAVGRFLQKHKAAWFVVAGSGPVEKEMQDYFSEQGLAERVRFVSILIGKDLVDCYASMNVFAFASQSETQGMVLIEAMAAGVPVVALDANGVREVVEDCSNGRKLPTEDEEAFAEALGWTMELSEEAYGRISREALFTASQYSVTVTTKKLETVYKSLLQIRRAQHLPEDNPWTSTLRYLSAEWKLFTSLAHAAGTALTEPDPVESEKK